MIQFYVSKLPNLIGPKAELIELRVPLKVPTTAGLLMKQFYLSNSVMMCYPKAIMVAAAFLACKVLYFFFFHTFFLLFIPLFSFHFLYLYQYMFVIFFLLKSICVPTLLFSVFYFLWKIEDANVHVSFNYELSRLYNYTFSFLITYTSIFLYLR